MKKIIAAVLIATLTLTLFAACGNKKSDETETTKYGLAPNHNGEPVKPYAEFDSNLTDAKEFKNADGKVVYKVEYDVPWLDDTYSEEAKTQFNNYIQAEFIDTALAFAENNVKNVRPDETEPRTIKISYEPVYKLDNVLSVVISTAYSAQSSINVYRTFNLDNGFVLHAEEFFTENVEETKEAIFDTLLPEAAALLPEDSKVSAEEKNALAAEKLAAGFDSASFYITDSYIAFIYNISAFSEGMGAGAGTHEFILDMTTCSNLGITNDPAVLKAK